MATYVCTIGGSTKALQQGWTIRETANGRSIFSGGILSADASYRPAIGAEFILTEDGVRIYGGNLDTPSEAGAGGFGKIPIVTRISAVDFNALADRQHVISGGFLAGTTLISALTDIIGYLTSYGVTLDAAQVTGPTLPLLQYDVRSITSILDELSVVTNYLWRIDYDKKLRMWLPGALTAPVSITTANRFAEGDVTVEPSRKDYANRIIIQAGTGTSEVTIGWIADGVATVFPLTYKLSTHRGYVTNQGVNETLGTGATWTYQSNTYPTLDTITRTTAPLNLNTISITYIAQFPYVTQSNDTGEQAANGIWEKVIVYPDVFDSTLAQNLASGQLLRSLVTSKTVKYITRQLGIKPGQTQTITVAERNISGTHLITDVQTTSLPTKIPTVQRTVTAVGGTQYPGSWRDAFKSSFGTSSGTTVGGTILITEGGGGGSSGTGTVGKLAKWTATDTLGDSVFTESGGAFTSGATGAGFTIALSASTVTGTLQDARLTANVPLKDNSLNVFTGSMTIEDTITNELIVSPSGAVGVANAGLAALSAGAGSGAPTNLTLAPTGDLITAPAGKDILPSLGYDTNIGMLSKKYLTIHAAELWVETLVAADVMATIGGRIVVAPTTTLTTSVIPTDTAINVKHNQMGIGDIVRLEVAGKVEFMSVTADAVAVPPNGYQYTVTRNLDGSGLNSFDAGDAVLNTGTGTPGNGFIDMYSMRGMRAGTEVGPTIVGNLRLSSTYNDWEPRWAIGNLNGLYGYGTNVFGVALGSPSAAWIKIDPTSGVRIGHAGVVFAQITAAGSASFTGSVTVTGGNAETTSGAQARADVAESNAVAFANLKASKNLNDTTVNWAAGLSLGGPSTSVAASVPATLTGAGLYLGSDFLGYYNGASWRTYMDNAGNFYLGGPAGALQWNGTTLEIVGTVIATAGAIGAFSIVAGDLSSGALHLHGSGQLCVGSTLSGIDNFWVSTTVGAPYRAWVGNTLGTTAVFSVAGDGYTAVSGITVKSAGYLALEERTTTPANPSSGNQWHAYAKGDKLIWQFNDGGTVRYHYLDGTAASGTWTHTTSAP